MSHPLNVVLLGLTGLGNTVLKALLKEPAVRVSGVFTRRYEGANPYYDEQQLLELCDQRGVVCHHDVLINSAKGLARLRAHTPDLILIALFKEILGADILAVAPRGVVNLHTSLLPRHRGPSPTQAALLSGDEISGITAHYAVERSDEGDILLQRRISIADVEHDGQLRQRLAGLAGDMIPELLALFSDGRRPTGAPQDSRLVTYAPRPSREDGFLEHACSADDVSRRVRALNPLPGTSVEVGGVRVPVDRCVMLPAIEGAAPRATDHAFDIVIGSKAIRLFRAQEPSVIGCGKER